MSSYPTMQQAHGVSRIPRGKPRRDRSGSKGVVPRSKPRAQRAGNVARLEAPQPPRRTASSSKLPQPRAYAPARSGISGHSRPAGGARVPGLPEAGRGVVGAGEPPGLGRREGGGGGGSSSRRPPGRASVGGSTPASASSGRLLAAVPRNTTAAYASAKPGGGLSTMGRSASYGAGRSTRPVRPSGHASSSSSSSSSSSVGPRVAGAQGPGSVAAGRSGRAGHRPLLDPSTAGGRFRGPPLQPQDTYAAPYDVARGGDRAPPSVGGGAGGGSDPFLDRPARAVAATGSAGPLRHSGVQGSDSGDERGRLAASATGPVGVPALLRRDSGRKKRVLQHTNQRRREALEALQGDHGDCRGALQEEVMRKRPDGRVGTGGDEIARGRRNHQQQQQQLRPEVATTDPASHREDYIGPALDPALSAALGPARLDGGQRPVARPLAVAPAPCPTVHQKDSFGSSPKEDPPDSETLRGSTREACHGIDMAFTPAVWPDSGSCLTRTPPKQRTSPKTVAPLVRTSAAPTGAPDAAVAGGQRRDGKASAGSQVAAPYDRGERTEGREPVRSPGAASTCEAGMSPALAHTVGGATSGGEHGSASCAAGGKIEVKEPRGASFGRGGVVSAPRGPARGLVGLENLGNTCFMNSAIQCLSNVPLFCAQFLTGRYRTDINAKATCKGKLAIAFGDLMKRLWASSSAQHQHQRGGGTSKAMARGGGVGRLARAAPDHASARPTELRQVVVQFASRFMGYAQHDAQEFLRFLLDGLHEDLNRVKLQPPYQEIDDSACKSDEERSACWWDSYCQRNDSCVKDIMCGQLRSQVVCQECQTMSTCFDPFWDLSVPIPARAQTSERAAAAVRSTRGGGEGSGAQCALQDCLKAFVAEEELAEADAYYCSHCKKHQPARKRLALYRLPHLLIVHIKRFRYSTFRRSKLSTTITGAMELDIRPYCADGASLVGLPAHTLEALEAGAAADTTSTSGHAVGTVGCCAEMSPGAPPPGAPPPGAPPPGAPPPGAPPSGAPPPGAPPPGAPSGARGIVDVEPVTALSAAAAAAACPRGSIGPGIPCTSPRSESGRATRIADAKPEETIYDLIGVSNHMGALGGGHYTADCFNGQVGQWHNYNDSRVSGHPPADVDTGDTGHALNGAHMYLLFYRRRCDAVHPAAVRPPP